MALTITKLKPQDIEKTYELMEKVINNSMKSEYKGNNLSDLQTIIEREVDTQKKRLHMDPKLIFPCFFIAKDKEEIVGVMGYGPAGKTVTDALEKLNQQNKKVIEVFSAYVSPNLQRQGISSKLLEALLKNLKTTNHQYFALYTRYQKGKAFWTKRLGDPTIILKDYFPGHVSCYVWVKRSKINIVRAKSRTDIILSS